MATDKISCLLDKFYKSQGAKKIFTFVNFIKHTFLVYVEIKVLFPIYACPWFGNTRCRKWCQLQTFHLNDMSLLSFFLAFWPLNSLKILQFFTFFCGRCLLSGVNNSWHQSNDYGFIIHYTMTSPVTEATVLVALVALPVS